MANALYPKGKGKLLVGSTGAINLGADNIKVALIDTADYTYDGNHEFLSDVPGGAIIATSGNLSGKSLSALGAFDSADPVFTGVTGDQFEALIMYKDTGSGATSPLIFYQDSSITGAPYTPVGNDVKIVVNAGGWWRL